MNCILRKWQLSDAKDLAAAINNEEEYWGRGIMTEAIRQLCKIVFDTTDILRIYAEPFAYNTGSHRALEKALSATSKNFDAQLKICTCLLHFLRMCLLQQ